MSREPAVTFGVGKYGKPVQQPVRHLNKMMMIIGTTRVGKTRLGNSIARQLSAELGAGQIIINYKPDPAFVAEKARDAERMGRSFLHFTLSPNGDAGFQRNHPYEPPRPCHYDPLTRGSGATRARMVVDSVVHNDQGDVYRRNAFEVTALSWDIAYYTGRDYSEVPGPNGVRTKKEPLQVLEDMLNLDELVDTAEHLNPGLLKRHHPHMSDIDAAEQVRRLQNRARSLKHDAAQKSNTIGSAIADTRSIASTYLTSSAFYPGSLSQGSTPSLRIDLLRAIVRGEFVMFSLSAADYEYESKMVGTMLLLDLQNTVSTLREYKRHMDQGRPDATPWPKVVVQIEELGTAANAASASALAGLVNKSADVGIIPIVSTQSLSDLRDINKSDVYLKRLTALTGDMLSLQIGEEDDDVDFCDFSGKVTKKIATEDIEVTNNRLRMFTGARQSTSIRSADTELPRVPYGTAQALRSSDDGDLRELLWITKAPELSAVHTAGKQGPNNWYETIQMVPVDEPPKGYSPFGDPHYVQRCELAAQIEALRRIDAEHDDGLLAQLRKLSERLDEERADVAERLGPEAAFVDSSPDDATGNVWDDIHEPPIDPGPEYATAAADDDIPLPPEPVDDMPPPVTARPRDQTQQQPKPPANSPTAVTASRVEPAATPESAGDAAAAASADDIADAFGDMPAAPSNNPFAR